LLKASAPMNQISLTWKTNSATKSAYSSSKKPRDDPWFCLWLLKF